MGNEKGDWGLLESKECTRRFRQTELRTTLRTWHPTLLDHENVMGPLKNIDTSASFLKGHGVYPGSDGPCLLWPRLSLTF